MLMSYCQNARQIHNTKVANKAFENVTVKLFGKYSSKLKLLL
jgi:hypothetical protein